MKKLIHDKAVEGVEVTNINEDFDCYTCNEAKMSRKPLRTRKERSTTKVGEIIHSDICGEIQTEAIGRYKYFLTFTDDFSRKTWVYLIREKSETYLKFRELRALLKTQGHRIQRFRCDPGGEYMLGEFKNYLNIK